MGYGDYLMLSGKLKYLDNEFNKKVQICFPGIENRKMFLEIFKNNLFGISPLQVTNPISFSFYLWTYHFYENCKTGHVRFFQPLERFLMLIQKKAYVLKLG